MIGLKEQIKQVLGKYGVAGASMAIVKGETIETVCCGYAVKDEIEMSEDSGVQYASLSKTVGTTLALEVFRRRGIDVHTRKVNEELRSLDSPWILKGTSEESQAWAEAVTLAQLCNHTALGMHYVPGLDPDSKFPEPIDLLDGKVPGYQALVLEREPGTSFKYSGGGFIVLQHMLELMLKTSIHRALADFLEESEQMAFDNTVLKLSADGYRDNGDRIPYRGGLVFPPLAAGGRGPPKSLLAFLIRLAKAYDDTNHPLHATARLQLDSLLDLGSFDFMRAKAGLGVFVATSGPNRIMLHQAANDGFRGLYCLCFHGPDKLKGFVLIANGDNNAMFANAAICNLLFTYLDISTLKLEKNLDSFTAEGIPQEQIVNLGYKDLVFRAFDD